MSQDVIDLTQDEDSNHGPGYKAERFPSSPIVAYGAVYTDDVENFKTPEPRPRRSSGANKSLPTVETSPTQGTSSVFGPLSPAPLSSSTRSSQKLAPVDMPTASGSTPAGRSYPAHHPTIGTQGLNTVLNKATAKKRRRGDVTVISDSDEECLIPRRNPAKRLKIKESTVDQPSHRVEQDGVYTTDPETSSSVASVSHKSERIEIDQSPPERDVDDWEWHHDGFIISCGSNWKEPSFKESNLDFDTESRIGSSLPMAIPSEKKSCSKIIGSAVGRSLDVPHGELMLDHTARDIMGSVTTPSERRCLHDHVARGFCDRLDRHMSLSGQFSLSSLSVVGQMSRAGGSINTVVQSGCFIGLSSDTVHGEADDPAMREVLQADVHNRPGTLQVNANGTNHVVHDHRRCFTRKVPGSDDYLFDKYYAVLAVAFDPNRPSWMISASTDGQVAVRDVKKDIFAAKMFRPGKETCMPEDTHHPHSLHFRATDSALAISCSDGSIFVYDLAKSSSQTETIRPRLQTKLKISGKDGHSVGHMAWGNDNMLYASTESADKGNHLGFDIQHPSKPVLKFTDAKDSGDALAIDTYRENLALVTRSHVGRHILRLYDVRRKRRTASDMTSLEAFHFDYDEHWDSEVTCASYSPDGRLLALARNDDRLHVYDTRYLNKRPLLRFFHWGAHRDDAVCGRDNDTQKLKRYGVTQMSWVQGWRGRGLGLVSGGGDGCVRLWDALGSDDDPVNGEVLAQTDWSIGSFSLGDSYNGEKPLVVGDNGARAYIYDRTSRIEDISP